MATLELDLEQSAFLFSGLYELKAKTFRKSPDQTESTLTAGALLVEWLRRNTEKPTADTSLGVAQAKAATDVPMACTVSCKKSSYLGISVEAARAHVVRDIVGHYAILEEVTGAVPEPTGFEKRNRFFTMRLPASEAFQLRVQIDSGSADLKRLQPETIDADNPEKTRTGLVFWLTLEIYVADMSDVAATFEIPVRLVPGESPKDYEGIITLDLGNTRSVLLCRDKYNENTSRPARERGFQLGSLFQVISLEPDTIEQSADQPDEPSAFSALRIAAMPPMTFDDHKARYSKAKYIVGDNALAGDEGLILSPKRLLADPRKDLGHRFSQNGGTAELPKNVPAELYIARLLQKFVRRKNKLPRRVRVTHPTTYGPQEIESLRRAVYSALEMASGETGRPPGGDSPESQRALRRLLNDSVPDPLDEASAAASYLMFRDFVAEPGAVRAFIDRYPDGLNVLVFDCGGGTTDVALVQARGEHEFHPAEQKETFSFQLSTLDRTGNRDFGGDEITLAVYWLIKAKIAIVVSRSVWERADLAEQIEELIKRPPRPLNQFDDWKVLSFVVPTTWMRESSQPGVSEPIPGITDVSARRQLVLQLWKVAEKVKRRLSDDKNGKVKLADKKRPEDADPDWNDTYRLLEPRLVLAPVGRGNAKQLDSEAVNNACEKIEISIEDVNRMVEPLMVDTVERINRMVQEVSQRNGFEDLFVGRIYLIGNASRYPLIKQCLLEKLQLLLAEKNLFSEDEDTKLAVAKGAGIHAWLSEDHEQVRWTADRLDRLPYDVVLRALGAGQPVMLFPRGTLFSEQNNSRLVPLAHTSANRVTLYRRWPGEEEISEYMVFDFFRPDPQTGAEIPVPPESPLRVTFDLHEQTYKIQDKNGRRSHGRQVSASQYIPYVQSGRI